MLSVLFLVGSTERKFIENLTAVNELHDLVNDALELVVKHLN